MARTPKSRPKSPSRSARTKPPSKTDKTPEFSKDTGVVTGRSTAMDYFVNMMARMGYGSASLAEGAGYEMVRLSNNYWLLLTMYRNSWLARRIVDLPANDMARAWPKLISDIEPDDIKLFDQAVRRTYTIRKLRQAMKWGRLYGGAGALMVIKGHEKILDEPLDIDDVNPKSYLGLIPFDRWVGITPEGVAVDDMESPRTWGLPEFYSCWAQDQGNSFKVHASRIIRLTGPDVPTPESQAQMYWGISVLEPVFEELRKKDNASWSILQLLFRANLIARIEPDLAGLLSGLGMNQQATQQFNARMQAQNELLSNQSMLILGKDADMKAIQYSFGGIGEVYAQFQMDTAGAAEIPVTRLFGRTVTGLGQSNDADERYYEEMIAQKADEQLRPALDQLYPVIFMSEFGEVPEDFDFTFPSIRVLSEEEKADKAGKAATPIIAAYSGGIISQQCALKELRQLGNDTNIFTNITDEDIDNAEDTPMLPGEQNAGPEVEEEETGEPGGGAPKPKGKAAAKDARALAKRMKWHGLDISVENEAGSIRTGKNHDGTAWAVQMTHDYGYLRNTQGVDGDHIDCFIGDFPRAEKVYVVHTRKAPEFVEYDEDKCFLNFASEADARVAFYANYDRPEHFGFMDTVAVGDFIDKVLATKDNPTQIR